MRKREFMKQIAALVMAAALIAVPVLQVSATPGGAGNENPLKNLELIEVDGSTASGGITPTVFQESYRNTGEVQYRSRTTYPSNFDLRTEGNSTTVKNQMPWGSCWAFGALSSLESGQLHGNTGNGAVADPDYSERQLAWFAYEPQTADSIKVSAADSDQAGEGITYSVSGRLDKGGNMPQATALLSAWQGAASETAVPYQNEEGNTNEAGTWDVAAASRNLSAIHLQNANFLASPAAFDKYESNGLPSADAAYTYDADATAAIKTALMNSGAVAIAYFADQSTPDGAQNGDYFNYTNYCQYVDVLDASTIPNHAVSIVGWDDDYSSTYFKTGKQPPANGAWLVKNSWGSGWGLNGYFWLSYYDRTIAQVTSFQGESADNYDNIYQYDYLGLASAMQFQPQDQETGIANVFTAKGNEKIQAVSAVTLVPDTTVSVKIYKVPADAAEPVPNGAKLIAEQSEVIAYSGYHTINLDTPVAIAAGEKFSVVQVIKGGDGSWYTPVEIGADASSQKAVCNRGESYMIADGDFQDMKDALQAGVTFGNAMIKAFTKDVEPESDAPLLQTFDYEAYDITDTKIKSETVTVDSTGLILNLPAGTSYIIIQNPVLSDSADSNTQLTVKVNGNDYTLGAPIAKADLIKENNEASVVMTTKSTPFGINTKDYEFSFSCDLLVLKADNDNVLVSDTRGYLPASAALTADKLNSGATFDAVKTALEPYGGADTFYVYNLTLTPALQTGESVNLGITTETTYPRTDKTVLYHFDEGSNILSEMANDSEGSGTLLADVSQMGCYVVAQVKEKPPVPSLHAITYSPAKTLADVAFPAADGGTWSWDDSSITPEVRTGSYKATFTPSAGSQYCTYHAGISLTVNKAAPVQTGTGSGSQITYGQKLADSVVTETFEVDSTAVAGTVGWKEISIQPEVSDGNLTEYDIIFEPADTDNYNAAAGKVKLQSVEKKAVTVSIKNTDKIYGDDNPVFALEIPDKTLAGDDTAEDLAVTFACAADITTAAGSTVDITGTSSSQNYDVTVKNGTLTIKKRTVNIRVKDVTIKYGDALPGSYEVEVINLVEGTDQSTLGLTADIEPQNVPDGNLSGTYTLNIKSASVTDTNYAVGSLFDGTLTITEVAAGKVQNGSSIPGTIAIRFGASGNLAGDEVLKISDLTDEAVQKAFQNMVKDGQQMGSAFDLSLKKADDTTDAVLAGALTVTIPVDTKYDGKQITVLHYVKSGKLNAADVPVDTDTIDVYSNLTVTEGKVQITVYSLSPFAVILPKDDHQSEGVYTPSADNSSKPKVTSKEVKGVLTGDSAPVLGLAIAALAALAVIVCLIIRMKRRK